MVSASSSRASSWKLKISSSGASSASSVRAEAVSVVAVSCESASSARVIAVLPKRWSWGGSWLHLLPSPGPAGAAERARVHRLGGGCGGGGGGAVGVAPVRSLAGGLPEGRGADGLRLAVTGSRPVLRVRLVPDRRVVPGLAGLVAGTLAPARQEDQQGQHQEDSQRDADEDEDDLGSVHGRQLTGRAPVQPGCTQDAGCRCAQGRASSTCADRARSVASSAGRPTSMLPIGSPSAVQYRGTLTAGWPVTLNSAVKEAYRLFRSKSSAPSPSVSNQPRGRGVIVQAGASRTS